MNVFELSAKISLNTVGFVNGLNSAADKAKSVGNTISGGLSNVANTIQDKLANAAKAAGIAIASATAGITAFAGSAVKAGMGFDSAMSQVAATMGKSIEDIQDLREFAKKMGSETAFSATQAAEALNYMALAGYDSKKSMAMLPNVLNLAAAGGMELAQASDMVTDAQSALGLSMDETTVLVDKMAVASSKSNTSVSQLGEAILTVGGTAKNLAGGTTELATTLGILADNGIKGAEGGTALRNIILSLSAPTDKAKKKMKEMNLEVFDANGNMRPLNETMSDLNDRLASMTQADKLNVMNDLFNKVDLKSVNALLANSGQRFDELSASINSYDSASGNMAKTQLDNLNGDITLLKSACEGLQIAVSDTLQPALRPIVQLAGDIVSYSAKAFSENLAPAIEKASGYASSLFRSLSAITKTKTVNFQIGKVKGFNSATSILGDVQSLANANAKQGFTDTLQSLASGIQNVVGGIRDKIKENAPEIAKAGISIAKGLISNFIENVKLIAEVAPTILSEVGNAISENLPKLRFTAIVMLSNLQGFIIENLPTIIGIGGEIIKSIGDFIVENLPSLISAAVKLVLDLAEFITRPDTLGPLVDGALDLIVALADGLIDSLPELLKKAPKIIKNLSDSLVDAIPKLVDAAKKIIKKLATYIIENAGEIAATGAEIVANVIAGILDVYNTLQDSGEDIIRWVGEGIMFAIDNASTWGADMIDNFINGIKGKWNDLKDAVSNIGQGIKNLIGFSEPKEGPLSNFHTYAPDMMELFAQGVKDNTHLITDQLSTSLGTVSNAFSTPVKAVSSGIGRGNTTININVQGMNIASDYDSYRFAQRVSEVLGDLQSRERMGVGESVWA